MKEPRIMLPVTLTLRNRKASIAGAVELVLFIIGVR
jgi:hypothetical protein